MINENEEKEMSDPAFPENNTVTPEVLLAQIVSYIGEEFVVIPASGWMNIVTTIQDYDKSDKEESIISNLEKLGVPVVPISLSAKEEESRIITPNAAPGGDSRIITA